MRSIGVKVQAASNQTARPSLREHLRSNIGDGLTYSCVNLGWNRIYGGQVIGQAIAAANQAVPLDSQYVNSIRTRFLQAGDVERRLEQHVTPIRTGKNFSWANINTLQDDPQNPQQGKTLVYKSVVSYKAPVTGSANEYDENFDDNMISAFEPPEKCETLPHFILGFEIKTTTSLKNPSLRALWIRRVDYKDEWTFREEQAALGYVSDFYFLRSAMHKHNLDFYDSNVRAASLCHSLFFHHPFQLKDWMLFTATAPYASSGRALVVGDFTNLKGQRVASALQEGIVWQRKVPTKSFTNFVKLNQGTTDGSESPPPLLKILQEPLEGHMGESVLHNFGWSRTFGGQLLGQSIIAADGKVNSEKNNLFLHSLHSHFISAGKVETDNINFDAKIIRNGRVYKIVEVAISQAGQLMFRGDASFATMDENADGAGIEHDDDLDDVQYNEKRLPILKADEPDNSVKDTIMPFQFRNALTTKQGFDMRRDYKPGSRFQRVLLKSKFPLGSIINNQAALAFTIDCLFPPMASLHSNPPIRMWGTDAQVTMASLCCSIYFHRPFNMHNNWLVIRMSSPIQRDERSFVKLDIYQNFGRERIATALQEVLMREIVRNVNGDKEQRTKRTR